MLAIMLVFVNLGNVIVQSGLNTALVQVPDASDSDFSTVFWMSLSLSVVLYVGVFFAAPAIASFYAAEDLVWPLRALALILIVNAYNAVQIARVTRDLELKKMFCATIVSVAISSMLGISLAVAGLGIWALVAQQLSYQLANCAALAFRAKWRPRPIFLPARARVLFAFGWKLLVSGLLDTGYQSLSDLVIGKQFSSSQLGLVSQGKKYPQAVGSMLDGAIQPVMLSAVAHVQSDAARVKRLVRRALKTSTFLIVPAMAMFALVAEFVVALLLGEQWLPAVPFLQMYCFIYALLPIHTANLQALNGMGRSDLFLKLELVKKAYGLTILLLTAFAIRDTHAIVAGYMLSGVISTFINARPSKCVFGYSYLEQIRDVAPAFLMAASSAAVAWPFGVLPLPSAVVAIAQCAVMGATYLALAKLFRVEAFSYLVDTVRELAGSRRSR